MAGEVQDTHLFWAVCRRAGVSQMFSQIPFQLLSDVERPQRIILARISRVSSLGSVSDQKAQVRQTHLWHPVELTYASFPNDGDGRFFLVGFTLS